MSGQEWVIDAHGCRPSTLADISTLRGLFASLVAKMCLHPVGEGNWKQFPGTGGVTGLQLLEESHLACHTFPEYGSLCLNVFCCRPRERVDFEALLQTAFGASEVSVRQIERPYQL